MTKKDYELIASAFAAVQKQATPQEETVLKALADVLCVKFFQQNPNFKRGTFLAACNL